MNSPTHPAQHPLEISPLAVQHLQGRLDLAHGERQVSRDVDVVAVPHQGIVDYQLLCNRCGWVGAPSVSLPAMDDRLCPACEEWRVSRKRAARLQLHLLSGQAIKF